jgi:hypothetical protein
MIRPTRARVAAAAAAAAVLGLLALAVGTVRQDDGSTTALLSDTDLVMPPTTDRRAALQNSESHLRLEA